MTDEIRRLWAVHQLDEEAARVRASLDRYPEERRQAETRLAGERALLEAHKEKTASLQKDRRELERQAESFGAEERKFQSQLPLVKKNEEYQALLHEIDGVKAKRSAVETQILEKLDEEESAEQERPQIDAELKRVEEEVRERLAALSREESADRDKLSDLEARRAAELEGISKPTRSRYERIHASRQGRAVVAISKNACGGCFRGQPPQVLQEARRGDRLLTCDGCGRLLIWPPSE